MHKTRYSKKVLKKKKQWICYRQSYKQEALFPKHDKIKWLIWRKWGYAWLYVFKENLFIMKVLLNLSECVEMAEIFECLKKRKYPILIWNFPDLKNKMKTAPTFLKLIRFWKAEKFMYPLFNNTHNFTRLVTDTRLVGTPIDTVDTKI